MTQGYSVSAGTTHVPLVEDDMAEADLIRAMLLQAGSSAFHMDHVQQLSHARRFLSGSQPQVVLLDLNLPDSEGLDGFEVLRKAVPWLPVIILTNVRDEKLAARAVRLGAQDYLIKREVTRICLRAPSAMR